MIKSLGQGGVCLYLKRLEMHGFKSFADRIEIEFSPGINAIVGPNGSGKSNVADAIRWVLGEQSIKNLRGSKLEDVIFAGSISKKPMGMAEVAITLDNNDSLLPLEYSDICFTRRAFRSGESEFYINKVPCRLKDIQELLMDTGIGKDGYSIISQGQVDEILTSRPEERRAIFEETAGIMKHKTRKKEAERRLEETLDNISRIDDILNEIKNQLEPLRLQKEKALKYQTLSEELKIFDVNLILHDFEKIERKLQSIKESLVECEQKMSVLLQTKTELINKINYLNAQVNKNEREHESIRDKYVLLASKKSELEKEIQFLSTEAIRLENEREKYFNSLDDALSKIENLKKALNEKLIYLEEKNKLIDKKEKLIEEKSKDLTEKEETINSLNKKTEALKVDVIDLLNSASEKKNMISSLKTLAVNLEKRLEQVEKEIAQIIDTNNKTSKDLDVAKRKLQDFHKAYRENEEKLKDIESELHTLNEKYLQNQQQVSKIADLISSLISKHKALNEIQENYEGYQLAVKSFLKAIKNKQYNSSGIYGTVADVISVEKRFELAIETALGGALQNIICSDEDHAKQAIDYLKKYKLGRVTFLPLTTVKARGLMDDERNLLSMQGCIGTAQELVKYDTKFHPVISNLLGRVLVVDILDNAFIIARKSGYRIRIVTLQGELLNPGGSITGGMDKRDSSLLSRKRQLKEYEVQIRELQKKLDNLKEEGEKLKSEYNQKQKYLEKIKNEIYEIKPEISALEKELSEKEKIISERIQRKKIFESEKQQILKETADIQKEIADLERDLSNIDDKNQWSQEEVKQLQEKIKNLTAQKENLALEVTELKVQLASHKQEKIDLERNIVGLQGVLKDLEERVEENTLQLKQSSINLEHVNQRINDSQKNLSLLQHDCDKMMEEEEKLKQLRELLKREIEKARDELSRVEDQQRRLEKRLNDIKINENTIAVEKNHIINRLYEKYFMTIEDARMLKKDLGTYSQIREHIEHLQQKINELGPVNIQAIEDYENLNSRYFFMKTQRDDLVQAAEKLNSLIKEITKTMETMFISSLEKVREEFRQVFVELFGGGKAELVLVGDENILDAGVDIIAQPPGKKLQSISLLSGGEKALTAIALLFAILKTKVTPFCILDEIEAALDDANIERFKNYLKKISKHTQFIIITHRKDTMSVADTLYGITMEESAVSKVLGVKFEE